MSIQTGELLFYRSATVSDAGANGGRLGSAEVADSMKNNIFPDPTQSERENGVTRYRKVFVKVANADDLVLGNAMIHLTQQSSGEDLVTLIEGTQRDTQAGLSDPREYGCGSLKTDVAAGDTFFVVVLESAADLIRSGDTVWIGDDVNEEYFADVTVERTDTDVTVTLAADDQLANAYAADDAGAAAVFVFGDLEPASSDWSVTSDAGTFDTDSSPLEVNNLGTVEDDWTITFESSDAFSVSGVYTGDLASGSIEADYEPGNTDAGTPYFSLPMAGWGGTWASGDVLSFSTHPASLPFWLKQVVPAGAAASGAVTFALRIAGESA